MKIYLDDSRYNHPDGWQLIKTAEESIAWLKVDVVSEISLDHDLGTELTGYDVALWIERAVVERNFIPPDMCCHSQNPVGRDKINAAIAQIKKIHAEKKAAGDYKLV